MSRNRVLATAVAALLLPCTLPWASAEAQQGYVQNGLLVTPATLNEHLKDKNLVVLQVGPKPTYDSAHVAGSIFVQLQDFSTPRKEGALALEMPPAEELRVTLEKLGISDDSRIVVVPSAEWISPATRVLLTLDYMGLGKRSAFLNGGLEAWKRAGLPVTTAIPTPVRGHITSGATNPLIVDYAYVQNHGNTPRARLIDARSPVFYDGPVHMGEPAGHIKGAVNIPFDAVYDDSSRVLPADALIQKFKAAGVAPGDTVVAYCHVGQQATALLFTARLLGHPVRLYDGSMDDWSKRKLPIEGGRPAPSDAAKPEKGRDAKSDLVVSPAWLVEHSKDRNLVVLHIGARNAYDKEHVAGSVFFAEDDMSTPHKDGALMLELPAIELLRSNFEKAGVSDDSRVVVVYGKDSNTEATRLMLTLDYLGLGERSALLNGGLDAWKRAGQPVTATATVPKAGHLAARPPTPVIVDYQYMQTHGSAPHVRLIDARSPVFYEGPPRNGKPSGHIKGAANIPVETLFDDAATLLPNDVLLQKFNAAGVQPGDTVVAYCHIGQYGTGVLLAARLLGHPVKLYDGSFQDWAERKLPIENARATPPGGSDNAAARKERRQ